MSMRAAWARPTTRDTKGEAKETPGVHEDRMGKARDPRDQGRTQGDAWSDGTRRLWLEGGEGMWERFGREVRKTDSGLLGAATREIMVLASAWKTGEADFRKKGEGETKGGGQRECLP